MSRDALQLMDSWGPEKIVCVSDRRTGMRGVLVIDNSARGMGKGGTRMSASLTVQEVARLARTMTWKWAASGLFYGGAKAGILADPEASDKESILRAFARRLADEVPKEYVFGLDMGLTENDAAILADELGDRGSAVGQPAALGGLPYDELGVTGFGVAEATDAAMQALGRSIAGARVAVQGFGAVGVAAIRRLSDLGAVVVGVSTRNGSIVDADGVDVGALLESQREVGDDCVLAQGGEPDPEQVLYIDTDVLVPAAREDVVDDGVARRTSATLVVEGANMPTTQSARAILSERRVAVVPDFIANAGGIIAAGHSMDARYSAFTVEPARVFDMVSSTIRQNTVTVLQEARRRDVPSHEAAWDLAKQRVREAMLARGQRDPLA
jgi:glutamate dehydrogenase (NAD(P)+)